MFAQTPPKPAIEARLTILTETLHEEDTYSVRLEIENVSDHTLLVGRYFTGIGNFPYRIELQLEDSSGHQYGEGSASFVDNPPIPDLSVKDSVSNWWIPLEPHTFMGIYRRPKLAGVPAGKYRLHAKYLSLDHFPPSLAMKLGLANSKIPIFQGALETNSIQVEVLTKKQ